MKIRMKLLAMTMLFFAGFVIFGIFAYLTMNKTKVNGEIYREITKGKDLVADIMPPPEYIIELYLTVMQMNDETDAGVINGLVEKTKKLVNQYYDRQEYWSVNYKDGEIKTKLTVDSAKYATQFINVMNNEFIPAILAGDREKADSILKNKLDASYDSHRKIIDNLVNLVSRQNTLSEEKADSAISSSTVIMAVIGAIIIIVTLIITLVISMTIIRSITKLDNGLKDIYDLTKKIEVNSKDEIGGLSLTINSFIDKLRNIMINFKRIIVKNNELGMNLAANTEEVSSTIEEITATMNSSKTKTQNLNVEIESSGSELLEVVEIIQTVVDLIDSQSASIAESSAAIEEMVSSINSISAVTETKKKFTDDLGAMAKNGADEMENTLSSIEEISKTAGSIIEMINVINNVAEQTDLLAMNAAIEAAHAGEYGKGFAVVADEIRKLAEATALNARDISASLNVIIDKIHGTSDVTKKTSSTISRIISGIYDVASSMNEMLTGMKEISAGGNQITQALSELISITEKLTGSSRDMRGKNETIANSMKNISGLSDENLGGINEMSIGLNEITKSTTALTGLSIFNAEGIKKLEDEISIFKTE